MSAEYMREYRKNNKKLVEKEKAYKKAYNQTPYGKKIHTITNWKQYGVICDDYDTLYESYLQATHCAFCKNEFKNSRDRCLDHDHETGLFRAFLCNSCNLCDVLKPSLTA